MNSIYILRFLIRSAACTLGFVLALGALHAEPSDPHKAKMTFVANEGILVADSQTRLLIDGIFGKSYNIFQTPDAATIEKLRTATPPFDRLTAVLVTHKDLDHANAEYVGEHMTNDPGCVLIAPTEVINWIHPQPGYTKFEHRVRAIPHVETESEIKVDQTRIRAIPLRHLPRPPGLPDMPYNVGYLFTVGGIKFFHTGDMNAENLAALQRANLDSADIDVLLINWYAFKPEDGRLAQAMIQYLNPKVVLLAHLTVKGTATEKALVEKLDGLPSVIALDTPMRTYEIQKFGNTVSVR